MTEVEALSAIRGNDPALAAKAEATLWQIWCRSGIREVDLLLGQGTEAMERQEVEEALALFTRIIERAPDFAEGGTSGRRSATWRRITRGPLSTARRL